MISETEDNLRRIFDSGNSQGNEIPTELQVVSYFSYSNSFLSSAELLESLDPRLFMQTLHCTGQSIELALKGYILSCGETPGRIHNLIELAKKVEELGFQFEKIQESAVVLISHYFYEDLTTNTRFKTRYPSSNEEMVGGAIPDLNEIRKMVKSLLVKSNENCSTLNLSDYVGIT